MKNDHLYLNLLLGDDAYVSVIDRLKTVVREYEAATIEGKQFCSDLYNVLNESITPMLDLKPFISKGEAFAGQDKTISDILSTIDKKVLNNTDLNFLINLAKEEHFLNMTRSGHPSPTSTVEAIKEEFDKTTGEVRKSIAKGIFDCLDSQILGDIKKKLGCNENVGTKSEAEKITKEVKEVVKDAVKPLNENDISTVGLTEIYSPIGFIFNDDCVKKDNSFNPDDSIVCVNGLIFKMSKDGFGKTATTVVTEEAVNTQDYLTLMSALNHCKYDAEANTFSPALSWDYSLTLYPENGEVYLNNDTLVSASDLTDLFIESIEEYKINPAFNDEMVRAYQHDADMFICLVDNCDMLVRFTNLKIVTSKTNTPIDPYVIFDTLTVENGTPAVIAANDGYTMKITNKTYDKYSSMIGDVIETVPSMNNISDIFNNIFMDMLKEENNNNVFRLNRIAILREQQSELNIELNKINDLILAAAANSPAMIQLNELKRKYDEALKANISELLSLS